MRDPFGRAMMRWRVRVVLPHVRGRLLDIGCGLNSLTRSYGGEGVGVDVHQWGDVDVVVKDSAALPFPDCSFDTVAIIAALNHITNRKDVLREARRLLKDGGLIITTMIGPLVGRIYHALRQPWDADQRERGMKEGEVCGMTSEEVRTLLQESGFKVKHEKLFMLGFNRLTIARKSGFNL
jgi:ubiquinone/menaquinone biosynthesis C-methylase UbiE